MEELTGKLDITKHGFSKISWVTSIALLITQLLKSAKSVILQANEHINRFHYQENFNADTEVKIGLFKTIERMYPDIEDRVKVDEQLEKFKKAEGMFGMSMAILTREKKQPALWWESYGEECKELQKLAIRVLSLTCSATGNWLEQQRLNALVFVKYKIQLELRQIKRQERGETYDPIYLSDMESDDEWITEKEDPCLPEDHSWMDIQECFEDDEGTTSKKRKRGPRNLNAIDRGKRKVFEDDDEVELIEGGEEEEEEEEEEEFDEVTMVDDDEDDIDLGDDED
ncbi:hypothetical protein LOK49_LG04G00681 [Camellia lanceoleosa]|uniref:Uncharacterized protein n=1 Tax=Camellia lanceoleosa TaxID=1840588 RepID=A0ACC0HYG5_9ERIC|nr:hypothetical protein LOK49_LG04G00681 [Camellia lanceoleosa]